MNTVSVLAATISVVSAIATVVLGAVFENRRNTSQRRAQLRHRSSRYSEPLLAAARSLRARLGNTTEVQIVEFRDGPDRFRDYALHETLYRIGRYLCVVHILSREARFLDLGGRKHNRELVERLGAVRSAINDRNLGSFLVLGGEQEAIGQLLVEPATDDGPPQCVSYPTFRERIDSDPRFARWLRPLQGDIEALLSGGKPPRRLPAVAVALDELIVFLDRRKIWKPWAVSERQRTSAGQG